MKRLIKAKIQEQNFENGNNTVIEIFHVFLFSFKNNLQKKIIFRTINSSIIFTRDEKFKNKSDQIQFNYFL